MGDSSMIKISCSYPVSVTQLLEYLNAPLLREGACTEGPLGLPVAERVGFSSLLMSDVGLTAYIHA